MKVRSLILGILLISFFSCSAHAGEKVAVLDFKSILAPPELGMAVAEILRTELIGVGDYTVIERGMLEGLIKEQELQLTGAVDSETAVAIGKLVGAQLVVIGSIVKTGSVYTINSRFIDVETGIARIGQNIRGQGEDQISHMVHQLALIIAGKTVTTEELIPEPERKALVSRSDGSVLLFSFETEPEVHQWQPMAEPPASMTWSKDHVTDGKHSLQIVFPKKTAYPELDTTFIPEDWSSYRILAFDLYYDAEDPDATWNLGVRIDDQQTVDANKKWFFTDYMIHPGLTTIRIYIEDIGKEVDLHQIRRIMLFTNDLENDVKVYLDNLRFETKLQTKSAKALIFSFEKRNDVKAWRPTNDDRRINIKSSREHPTLGSQSLKVKLPKTSPRNEYLGIWSGEFPRDWVKYSYFSADLYLEKEKEDIPIELAVRVDDASSTSFETRFNWDMRLESGANRIYIPIETINEAIDISQVTAVYIFLNEPEEKTTIYFDNIRLE